MGAFRLSLRIHKRVAKRAVRKDWSSLKDDTDLCERVVNTLKADLNPNYEYTDFVDAAIHSYDHVPNLASVDTRYVAWNNPALAKVRVKIKKHTAGTGVHSGVKPSRSLTT